MQPETTRVEAFSDRVFAIAITLLILEIKVLAPAMVMKKASIRASSNNKSS